jgi:site-specific recombinase XerD
MDFKSGRLRAGCRFSGAKMKKENFWLHKFRATFATRCLWNGIDLRTVQSYLGHTDLESTRRYLKPSRSQKAREKMNEVFASVNRAAVVRRV